MVMLGRGLWSVFGSGSQAQLLPGMDVNDLIDGNLGEDSRVNRKGFKRSQGRFFLGSGDTTSLYSRHMDTRVGGKDGAFRGQPHHDDLEHSPLQPCPRGPFHRIRTE